MITFLVKHLHANINLLRKVLIEDSRLPFTPLTLAISIGVNNQIIETLIDLGAHINIHTNAGYSTLTLALLSNNIELATLLLKKGFDINLENNNGVATLEQILFHLSYNISQPEKERDIAAIKFLLAHGAYANRLNSNGFTPLKMARDYKLAPEVIDLLKKNAEEYRKAKTIAHWV
jgi:ankyrin repeat protein